MRSRGCAERVRATQAPPTLQDTASMGPITRSFKRYNLRSRKRKLVEEEKKCFVSYPNQGFRRRKMGDSEDLTLWTPALEAYFVQLLMEETNAGRLCNAKFNKLVQATATEALNRSGLTRVRLTMAQVKGKWTRMKRNHSDFAFLLRQTGFGWCPEAETVEGTDEAWANVMRMNPKLNRFKVKGCPHYRILGHIFNRSTATGVLATPCTVNPMNSDEEPHLDRALLYGTVHIDLDTPQEVNGTPEAGLQNNPPLVVNGTPNAGLQNNQQPYVSYKRMSHASCSYGSKGKKAKLDSNMSNACRAMTKLCNAKAERSSSSRSYQQQLPLNQCIHWLNSLDPPLPNDQYENAVDCLLKDKELQIALMAMTVERRMVRLARLIQGGV